MIFVLVTLRRFLSPHPHRQFVPGLAISNRPNLSLLFLSSIRNGLFRLCMQVPILLLVHALDILWDKHFCYLSADLGLLVMHFEKYFEY